MVRLTHSMACLCVASYIAAGQAGAASGGGPFAGARGQSGCAGAMQQCGGDWFGGPSCCEAGYNCTENGFYAGYKACMPIAGGSNSSGSSVDGGSDWGRYVQGGGGAGGIPGSGGQSSGGDWQHYLPGGGSTGGSGGSPGGGVPDWQQYVPNWHRYLPSGNLNLTFHTAPPAAPTPAVENSTAASAAAAPAVATFTAAPTIAALVVTTTTTTTEWSPWAVPVVELAAASATVVKGHATADAPTLATGGPPFSPVSILFGAFAAGFLLFAGGDLARKAMARERRLQIGEDARTAPLLLTV